MRSKFEAVDIMYMRAHMFRIFKIFGGNKLNHP